MRLDTGEETDPVITHFNSCVTYNIKTSHLISNPNPTTGFYMKCNTGLK